MTAPAKLSFTARIVCIDTLLFSTDTYNPHGTDIQRPCNMIYEALPANITCIKQLDVTSSLSRPSVGDQICEAPPANIPGITHTRNSGQFHNTVTTGEYLIQLLETGCFTAVSEELLQRVVEYYPFKLSNRLLMALLPPYAREINLTNCTEKLTLMGLVEGLKKCQHLKSLNLQNCSQLLHADVFTLSGLLNEQLTTLVLEGNRNITDDIVKAAIQSFPNLISLNISCCTSVTDDVFLLDPILQLKRETSQKHIEEAYHYKLSRVDMSGISSISSVAVRHLSSLCGPNLRQLNLAWSTVDSTVLFYLAGFNFPAIIDLVLNRESELSKERDLKEYIAELKEIKELYSLKNNEERRQSKEHSNISVKTSSNGDISKSTENNLETSPEKSIKPETENVPEPIASIFNNCIMNGSSDNVLDNDIDQPELDVYIVNGSSDNVLDTNIDQPELDVNFVSGSSDNVLDTDIDQPELDVNIVSGSSDNVLDTDIDQPELDVNIVSGSSDNVLDTDIDQPELDVNFVSGSSDNVLDTDIDQPELDVNFVSGSSDNVLDTDIDQPELDVNIVSGSSDNVLDTDIDQPELDVNFVSGSSDNVLDTDIDQPELDVNIVSGSSDNTFDTDIDLPEQDVYIVNGSLDNVFENDIANSHQVVNIANPEDLQIEMVRDRSLSVINDQAVKTNIEEVNAVKLLSQNVKLHNPDDVLDNTLTPTLKNGAYNQNLTKTALEAAHRIAVFIKEDETDSDTERLCDIDTGKCDSFTDLRERESDTETAGNSCTDFSDIDTDRTHVCTKLNIASTNSDKVEGLSDNNSSGKNASGANQNMVLKCNKVKDKCADFETGDDMAHGCEVCFKLSKHIAESRLLMDTQGPKQKETAEHDCAMKTELSDNAHARNCDTINDYVGNLSLKTEIKNIHCIDSTGKEMLRGSGDLASSKQVPFIATDKDGFTEMTVSDTLGCDIEDELEEYIIASGGHMDVMLKQGNTVQDHLVMKGSNLERVTPELFITSSKRNDHDSEKKECIRDEDIEHARNVSEDSTVTFKSVIDDDNSSNFSGEDNCSCKANISSDIGHISKSEGNLISGDNLKIEANSELVQLEANSKLETFADNSSSVHTSTSGTSDQNVAQSTMSTTRTSLCVCLEDNPCSNTTKPKQTSTPSTSKVNDNMFKETFPHHMVFKPGLFCLDITNIKFINRKLGQLCLETFLRENPILQKLELSWKGLTEEFLKEVLPNVHDLTEVSLEECTCIQSGGLAALLKQCQNLRDINLRGVVFIKDMAMAPLYTMDNLTKLNLAESEISDATLFRISNRCGEKITELDLSWCEGISERGINYVCLKCTQLQRLVLRSCPVSNITLHVLSKNCPQLTELIIDSVEGVSSHEFSDDGLLEVADKLLQLQILDISWNLSITNVSVVSLMSNLVHLTEVHMKGLKQITCTPFLPIISGVRDENGNVNEFWIDEYCNNIQTANSLRRSTVFAPNLSVLGLEYSDLVEDKRLELIVKVCRGSLEVTDYYGRQLVPDESSSLVISSASVNI